MHNEFRKGLALVLVLVTVSCLAGNPSGKDLKLWYSGPAENWNEAAPIGDGWMVQCFLAE